MSLRSCMSPNIQAGTEYFLLLHGDFVDFPAGWCEFKTVSDDVLEGYGHAELIGPGNTYDFEVRITTQPGLVLTIVTLEGGKPVTKLDKGATLSGCTLQAKYLLGGQAFTMKALDATTTEIDFPGYRLLISPNRF